MLIMSLDVTRAEPNVFDVDVSTRLWVPQTLPFDPQLVRKVMLHSRDEPVAVSHTDELVSGAELIALEALHSTVDVNTAARAIAALGIAEHVLEKIIPCAMTSAEKMSDLIIRKTIEAENSSGMQGLRRQFRRRPALRTILGAKCLAVNVHKDEKRMNGLPYDSHPNVVDSLVRVGCRNAFARNDDEIIFARVNAWTHDTWESAFSNGVESPITDAQIIGSPLVQATMLRKMDVPEHIALRTARQQLLLTPAMTMRRIQRQRAAAGHPLEKGSAEYAAIKDAEYKASIAVIAGYPRTALVKRADIKHNAEYDPQYHPIDKHLPGYPVWLNKLGVYQWSADYIEEQAATWPVSMSPFATAIKVIDGMMQAGIARRPFDFRSVQLHAADRAKLIIG